MEDSLRGTGRTTRLCNEYIDTLFKTGSTGIIRDHFGSKKANEMLVSKIRTRLKNEFKGVELLKLVNQATDEVTLMLVDYNRGLDHTKENEVTDSDVIAWRDDIDKLLHDLKKYPRSRHMALAITHLEDAQMRLGCLFDRKTKGHIIKR